MSYVTRRAESEIPIQFSSWTSTQGGPGPAGARAGPVVARASSRLRSRASLPVSHGTVTPSLCRHRDSQLEASSGKLSSGNPCRFASLTHLSYTRDMPVTSSVDIQSGKSYDIIYHRYDMDIPNANNLERHILVIYFLTFGHLKYFKMSYTVAA